MSIATVFPLDRTRFFGGWGPAQSTCRCEVVYPGQVVANDMPAPQLPLYGKIMSGWEFVRPLMITVEKDEDEGLILSDDQFMVYGCGDTFTAALQDYVISLIEYYDILMNEVDAPTQAAFRSLQSYFRPTA